MAKFHGGANKGFVHARHADTVAGFLASRTINFFSHGSPLPRESLAPIEAMKARKKAAPSSSRVAPRHQTKQIGHFAEARLAQMLGDYKTAQHHYRLVARSDAASSYGLAAAKFLDNPVP
ncbi:MAG: hypothetical protein WAT18_10020 [Sphingorhabdus sp.]|uniref:hypothetical protein n=1 Tax=Sphingorhabdus sp. TaxID=1902408 RepID=UPI003BAFBA01|nr:hypothetical protein [Sphingomonadales bacterium]